MPELPEVEVTRRSLQEGLQGFRIEGIHVGKPLRWPLGCMPGALVGRVVERVRRRGKYLLLDLDEGLLLIHLGMSGSLRFASELPPPGPHDHFELRSARGVMRLHDPRRFGAVVYAEGEASPVAQKLLGKLGMEPLGSDYLFPAFLEGMAGSRLAIKQWLLAGHVVVGVGNIYASEALFMAGIRPTTAARRIGRERARRLYLAIREVLSKAVEAGGTTLRDFSGADGMAGHFQNETQVYGRDGLPCRVCGTPIRLLRQGQRSTYYCPGCQRG